MNRMCALALLLVGALAWPAFGEDNWLRRSAEARSDPSAAGDVVVKVTKGDRVQVLEKNGAWVKVDVKGQQGWLAADSLSGREVKPDVRIAGMGSSAESSSGAAAKGLQDMTINYAARRRLSTRGVDEMVDIRKSIKSQMLKDFVAEGNIQPPRRRTASPAAGEK